MKYSDEEVKAGWARIEGQTLQEVPAPIGKDLYDHPVGSYWIKKEWHPDGHCDCWEVRQLQYATGKYAKEGAVFWKTLTSEPFAKLEHAEAYLKSVE